MNSTASKPIPGQERSCVAAPKGMLVALLCVVCTALVAQPAGAPVHPSVVDPDGTIHVQAFEFPESSFLSGETLIALGYIRALMNEWTAAFNACPSTEGAARADMFAIRQCQADAFYGHIS